MGTLEKQIKLGISACLLGERVRYDGGHKLDRFLVHTLGRLVDFHSRHKLLLLSHSVELYRQMGKLVAAGKGVPAADEKQELLETFDHYRRGHLPLIVPLTLRNHV